jgi:hypothetical protein
VRNYYITVHQIFDEEFTFVNKIINNYQNTLEDGPALSWIVEGGKLMRLVYDFDKEIEKCGFDQSEVMKSRDAIRQTLSVKHPDYEKKIDFLIMNWKSLTQHELIITVKP